MRVFDIKLPFINYFFGKLMFIGVYPIFGGSEATPGITRLAADAVSAAIKVSDKFMRKISFSR